ncbi:MAG: sialate O-acetylesterase [Chitinophagales bacterium]
MIKHVSYLLVAFALFTISCEKDLPLHAEGFGTEECNISSITKHEKAVILVLGQSNSANAGETLYTASCYSLSNFYDGELYPLADPLLGSNGGGGSVWSRLGDILMENNFAKEIIFAPAAIGGTSVQQWVPNTGNLNHLIVNTIESLQENGHEITHILWHQGESNNHYFRPDITPEENGNIYQNDFLLLANQIRSMGIDAPIFVASATRCGTVLQPDLALQQAQQDLANENQGIFHGPNTDLLGNEYRYDDCHFSHEGLKIHATMWADILLTH